MLAPYKCNIIFNKYSWNGCFNFFIKWHLKESLNILLIPRNSVNRGRIIKEFCLFPTPICAMTKCTVDYCYSDISRRLFVYSCAEMRLEHI